MKERMLTGIKPTGNSITLGNYIGGLLPLIKYQDQFDLFLFVADLHALTVYQKDLTLGKNIENLVATYLAAGIDPNKVTIFKQSEIPEHTQLEWVLTCTTDLPDLLKMPQYKNYKEINKNKAVPAGMLMYPSLMNADILLYNTDYIPVGIDQKPHVNLCYDIAMKFNARYGETFKIPKPIVPETGAKIMSLTTPTKKMSKSESDNGTIYLLEDIEIIRRKIMKAITDSENKVYFNPETKPGVSNLLSIYSALSEIPINELEKKYENTSNYGVFKKDLADLVCDKMAQIQARIKRIKELGIIHTVLQNGANKASCEAHNMLETVYKKVGLK